MKKFLKTNLVMLLAVLGIVLCTQCQFNPEEGLAAPTLATTTRATGEYNPITAPANYSVTLRHLKWRDGVWSWSKWKANTNFSGYEYFLNGRNASNWNEIESEHIFMAEVWKPAAANIENVVFLSAGQQGALVDRQDYPAIVTGQQSSWHKKLDASLAEELNSWKYIKDKTLNISTQSIGGQIISDALYNNSGYFGMNSSNTYMALVFDACFYYEMSAAKKNERLTDYLEWLMSRTNNNQYKKIRNVYMAGASRGGALVTRMGYEMTHNTTWRNMLGNAKIIVSSFDGVANEDEGELWTTTAQQDNPLEWINGRYCFVSTLHSHISNPSNLHIYQIAGGADVVPVIVNKHAFYVTNLGNALRFKWVDYSHTQIGQEWHTDTCVDQLRWMALWLC